MVGDVVMVVIKNQGATKFAKARVLLFKDNANGTRAQVQIVEEDIGDHPIGTKLWRIPEDMRAIPTGDDDCEDDELQEDSSAPKSPPKKKHKKKRASESQFNNSASRSNKSAPAQIRVPAKKQVHQRNRPSISDFDDIGDDTNSKFSEEALESRDLENLDEFQEITKQMVSCFGLLVSLLLVNHRRFFASRCAFTDHAGSKIMAHGLNWPSIRKPRAQGQ